MTVETFKIEVLPLKHKLYRFAKRLLKNATETEDIVQEVFIRLWTRRERLSEYKSIEAFAMIITKNLCLDNLKSKRNNTDELTEKYERMTDATPYEKVELNDTYNKVQEIINTLPEQQKMIIHLRDIEGYEFNEIAEIVQISSNTIRVNLSRARKKVRETLINTYNYEFAKN
ncbi:MAG: sigma-70 family RNA polymerase sigma factor [Bacteroidetes bacterium]|nr:sigma-70 family RNA polymerase sigma factor [Bacteroidota bacterium]MBL7103413.1 sigma-70 family RNA polymerase sigma factor [Bacteroidales bacterium]